jgi:signal transduction histidine kinase
MKLKQKTSLSDTLVFDRVEPTTVYADRDKIGQVISNLVSNAIKYPL